MSMSEGGEVRWTVRAEGKRKSLSDGGEEETKRGGDEQERRR